MRKASKWARALMVYILCIAITFTMTPVNLIAWGADETNQQTEQAQEAASEDVQQDGQNAEQFGENDQTSSDQSGDQAEEPAANDQNAAADGKADSKEEATDTDNAKSDAVTNSNADNDAADPKGKESIKDDSDKAKEKAKDEYPAAELSGSAGSVSVSIRAPKGALPKGAKVKVESVNKADVIVAADDVVDGKIKDAKAANITFYDKDGNKIEPKKAVNVSFNASGLALGKNRNVYVVHIADSGGAQVVDASVSGTNASFSTRDFSTYAEVSVTDTYEVKFYESKDALDTGNVYKTKYYDKEDGQTLGELPADPGKEGAVFSGWQLYSDGTAGDIVSENTGVTDNMQLVASYTDMVTVTFKMNNGTEEKIVGKYELQPGTKVGTLPQDPFKEGAKFDKWVNEANEEEEITADTLVPENGLTAIAKFTSLEVYDINVKYFYMVGGQRVDFDNDIYEIEKKDVGDDGYEIAAPASTVANEISGKPTYYPATPTIYVTKDDLASATEGEDGKKIIIKEIQYVEYTAEYDFVYMLKNLNGDGYTEIEREHVKGVLNSTVTPTVKPYDYAEFERLEAKTITEAAGTELHVYYTRNNFTLSYETNGGSYIAAQTVPYGTEVEVAGEEPTRTGYDFAGWYTDEGLTKKAPAKITLEKDTTLYAKWTGKNVDYTIVYMFEKYNDAGTESSYVYDNSETRTAKVGTTIKATDSSIPNKTRTGWEKDTDKNAESSVEIKADGSSVLYVYYKLKDYTFNFNAGAYYYGYYNVNATLVGKNVSGTGTLNYTMKVKLGQNISSAWPVDVTGTYRTGGRNYEVGFIGWVPDGSQTLYVTKRTHVTADMLPSYGSSSITYTAQWSNSTYEVTINYWLQNANNNQYTKSTVYSQTAQTTGGSFSAKDIAGYTYNSSKDDHKWTGGWGSYIYEYNFYYDRNTYNIDYYDGSTKLSTKENVKFDANINSATYNYTPVKPVGKEDYTWGGWCSDAGLTTAYTFDKMPASNLVLYAKWIPPQYTVTYDLQGGDAEFDTSETVDKGSTVSFPGTPIRENYTFAGWWTGPEGDEDAQLYDWNYQITDDTTVYAHWKQKPLKYTVHYYKEGTTDQVAADKVVENPSFTEGQKITETAYKVTGLRPDANTKDVTLSFDDDENVITFYYSEKAETTKYKVNYVLQSDHSIKVYESKTKTVDGSQISVVELAAAVDKDYMATQTSDEDILRDTYYPLDNSIELTLTSNEDENVITFEYANFKTTKVTVNYVDMDGDPIPGQESVTEYLKLGSTYQVKSPSINGYIYHHTKDQDGNKKTQYTITDSGELKINVYYQRKLNIIAENKSKTYDGTALTSEGIGDLQPVDGLAEGHTLTGIEFRGSQTNAGSSKTVPQNATITGPKSDNYYDITYVPGTLTVTPLEVTVYIDPDRYTGNVYNGTQYNAGFCNQNKQPEDYISIPNATYKNAHLSDFVSQIEANRVLFSKTDAGHWTKTANEIKALFTVPKDDNYKVILETREAELEIKPVDITITSATLSKEYDGTALTNGENAVSVNGNWVGSDGATYSFTGSQLTVGSSSNAFTYTLKEGTKAQNYNIITVPGTLTVTDRTNKYELEIEANSTTAKYDGTEHTAAGLKQSTFTVDGNKYTVTALTSSPVKVNAGEYPNAIAKESVVVKDALGNVVTDQFDVTTKDGKLTIDQRNVTLTSETASKAYDGTALTKPNVTVTGDGFVDGEVSDIKATGSVTTVEEGEVTNTITYTTGEAFSESNYSITKVEGKLSITKRVDEITITAPDAEKKYDGTALTASEATVTGVPDGYTVTATVEGSATDVSDTKKGNNKVTGYVIKKGNVDVTGQFDADKITVSDGTLTITPRTVTLTSETAEKPYDGAPLTKPTVSISGDGFVNGEVSDIKATGSVTTVEEGEVTNTITYKEESDFKSDNYKITKKEGTLKITPIDVTVTITGKNNTADYDGTEHSVSGYDVEISNKLYKESDFTFSGTAEAKRTKAGTTNMGLAKDQFTNTNKNFKKVTFNVTDGYQTIKPIDVTVTITGKNNTADYDGSEHSVSGYDVEISNKLYKKSDFTFSGTAEAKRTDAGTTNMGLKATQFKNTNDNFNVTFEVTDGYQTIKKINAVVTIEGNTSSADYDGKEHSISGYAVTKVSTALYPAVAGTDFTFSGTAEAKRTDAGKTNMGLDASQFTNINPNFETVTFNVKDGYQEIKPIDVKVTITGKNNTTDYDGAEHKVTGYTAKADSTLYDVNKDFTFSGTAEAKRTNAGTTNMGLKADQFKNNNDNFNVTFDVTDGYQKIKPIDVKVTITGNNNTADYNGAEHKVTGYTAEADSTLYDVDKDFTFSGTAEAKRTNAGTTNMGLKADQFRNTNDNFNVTFNVTDGYQTIKKINATVTIKGHFDSRTYDAAEHSVSGYDVEISNKLYKESDFTFSGTASAARTDEGKTMMGLAAGQFKNKNDNFETVTFNVTDGYQEIVPVDEVVVTITGKNNTTDYDGAEHKVTGYDVEISNKLYKESDFTFSGTAEAKRTAAGTTNMGLKAAQFTNTNKNFKKVTFNVTDGYQTINKINAVVTIEGNTSSADYDGKEHSISGYTVTNVSTALYPAVAGTDFTFSGTAEAKRTDAGKTEMGLKADQFKNINPNFETVTFNVTDGYQEIKPIDVTVTITGKNSTADYDGTEHTVTGYTAKADSTLYDVDKDITFSGKAEAKRTNAGQTDMGLKADQFKNNNTNFANVTFTIKEDGYQKIKPIDVTVTITGNNNTADYDGAEHKVTGYTAKADSKLYDVDKDFTFSGTAEAKRTDAGTTNMGLKADQFKNNNDNFNVTFEVTDGYQGIKPIDVKVTITGENNTADYDGAEHKVTGYTAKADSILYDVDKDFTFSGTAEAKRTDAGKTNMGLDASQFTNINPNFETVTFNVKDGYQEIKPIDVKVTITGKNNTTDYDGAEHKVTGYTAKADSTLYDVNKDFTFSGTAEAKRTNAGTTNMGLKADQFRNTNDNFGTVTFEVTDGYQKIKPIDVTVTITGNNNTADYDGTEHKVTGYTAKADSKLYDVDKDFEFNGTAEAKRTDAGTTNMGLKADQFSNKNANFGTVTFNVTDGYQTISKINATVTIKGHFDSSTYDAAEHSVSGYDVEISNKLYKESDFTFSGTASAARTDEGKTMMGLAKDQFKNKNDNFETVTFNVTDGYQEIVPVDEVVVTITGKNNTTDYDGTEHKVTGYDVKISNKLYKESDFTFSGTAEAKRTTAGTTNMGLKAAQFTNTNKNFKKVTFNVTDGYQTISKINATVTIEGNTSSADYDGTEHSISGYTVTNVSTELYPAVAGTDFTFSGTAEAKRTDAGKTEMGLKADQFKNINPNFETVTFNVKDGYQEIKPIDVTVTITGNNNTADYDEAEHKVTGYTAKADSKLYDVDNDFTFNGTAEAKRTDVGTTYMNLAAGQFTNTNKNFETVTFEVTDGYQKIKKAGGNEITPEPGDEDEKLDAEAKNLTVKYDGKAHTVKATATKDGSKIEYKTGGGEWSTDAPSRTNAGTTEFSIRATNPNYKDIVIDGYKLIVTKREVTLTSESDEKIYDGKALTNHNVKVSGDGFADGESAAYTFSGSRTNAGTSRNTFDVVDKNGRVMKLQAEADAKGIDEQNYDITKRYGTLTVTKAPLTITTSSASKAYDGKALTADAKVNGLVNGETVTVNATGSQTDVGSSKNTYSLKWNGTASESNYEITEHLGTLTITASPSDNVDPDPGNNGGDDPSGGGTTPPSGNTNPGRGGNGGNTPTTVNGGTTRTNGALTASTNTSSASTVTGDQKTDKAPQDITEIKDQKTPLAKTQDKWALLNLILMILTVLLCLWMAAGTLRRNQDADRNEDEKTVKRKKILKLLSLIPAIAAVIAFILTEDMTLPMQMTDKWTILMLIIFVVQVVMRILTKNKKDEEDNNKNAYA